MKVDNSRSSAPPNMNHRLRHRNRQILIWMAVLVFFTAACSGGSPHQTAVPSSAQSTAHLNSPSSSATAFKPSPVAGTVPNMAGMSLAAARAALATAGFENYSWLYGCYGSRAIDQVDKQTPGGGAADPQSIHVQIYLQADNCRVTTLPHLVGLTLAAARAALATAGFDTYTWVYHCYGSPDIEGVDKQTPPGGARVPEYTHVYIYLQAGNC